MDILLIWALFGFVGIWIAQKKGINPALGFLAGMLLGPFVFLMLAVKQPDMRKCPRCAEFVKAEATVCKHCKSILPALLLLLVLFPACLCAADSCRDRSRNRKYFEITAISDEPVATECETFAGKLRGINRQWELRRTIPHWQRQTFYIPAQVTLYDCTAACDFSNCKSADYPWWKLPLHTWMVAETVKRTAANQERKIAFTLYIVSPDCELK